MVDNFINLMSRTHHKCKRMKNNSLYPIVPKNYSNARMTLVIVFVTLTSVKPLSKKKKKVLSCTHI